MTPHKFAVLELLHSPRGFVVVPIHYSHDPDKNAAWRDQEKSKYPDEVSWQREQEIDFGSISGVPVYRYRPAVHAIPSRIKIVEDLPLCLCVDFNVEPMVWEVGQLLHECFFVSDEIYFEQGSTQ
ncbi:hypothetical protein RZS08_16850, partial [Arthrospira platensis SPKY1]|nr:hypothetical protein [Arthrospira platensis SPKY1]